MATCEGQYGINEVRLRQAISADECAAHCLQQKGCTVFIHSQESTDCWWQWVGHDFKCHKKRNLDEYNLYAVTPGVLPYLAHAFKKYARNGPTRCIIFVVARAQALTHAHIHAHTHARTHTTHACCDCLQPLERKLTRQQLSQLIGKPHAGTFKILCMVATQVSGAG